MNLSNQVTSLEVSRRLKECGVKQETFFMLSECRDMQTSALAGHSIVISDSYSQVNKELNNMVSAYTVAELLHILPAVLEIVNDGRIRYFDLTIYKQLSQEFSVGYVNHFSCEDWIVMFNDKINCPNGLAELLIWGVKEGDISIEEINKKL